MHMLQLHGLASCLCTALHLIGPFFDVISVYIDGCSAYFAHTMGATCHLGTPNLQSPLKSCVGIGCDFGGCCGCVFSYCFPLDGSKVCAVWFGCLGCGFGIVDGGLLEVAF